MFYLEKKFSCYFFPNKLCIPFFLLPLELRSTPAYPCDISPICLTFSTVSFIFSVLRQQFKITAGSSICCLVPTFVFFDRGSYCVDRSLGAHCVGHWFPAFLVAVLYLTQVSPPPPKKIFFFLFLKRKFC